MAADIDGGPTARRIALYAGGLPKGKTDMLTRLLYRLAALTALGRTTWASRRRVNLAESLTTSDRR